MVVPNQLINLSIYQTIHLSSPLLSVLRSFSEGGCSLLVLNINSHLYNFVPLQTIFVCSPHESRMAFEFIAGLIYSAAIKEDPHGSFLIYMLWRLNIQKCLNVELAHFQKCFNYFLSFFRIAHQLSNHGWYNLPRYAIAVF